MRKSLLFVLSSIACLLPPVVFGDTHTAASCSLSDVQAQVTVASDGDTVSIPVGSSTWTSYLTVTNKAITLKGAGVNQTTIFQTNTSNRLLYIIYNTGKPFRITGIRFDGSGLTNNSDFLMWIGDTSEWSGSSYGFRIDHCDFKNIGSVMFVHGFMYGLIDNCSYYLLENHSLMVPSFLCCRGDGDAGWRRPLTLGTSNAVYVEDNYIYFYNPGSADRVNFASQNGARIVFRNNRAVNGFIETFGRCDYGTPRGTLSAEIYDNIFTGSCFVSIGLKGGTGVTYNNTIVGSFNTPIWFNDYRSCDPGCMRGGLCDGTKAVDGNELSNGWPCADQVGLAGDASQSVTLPQLKHPQYVWGNTYNGSPVTVGSRGSCSLENDHIVAGRDYYNAVSPTYSPYVYPHPLQSCSYWGDCGSVDTSSPSAPGFVYDGTGADVSSTTSSTQLSANWGVAVDTESLISGYQYGIGTTSGGTDITGWTGNGTTAVTKTGLTLALGTTYYFTVRAVNGSGLIGSSTNSNGQVAVFVSTTVVDTSSPTAPGAVRDGAVQGVDISSTMSNNTLSANWTAGTDAESAVTGYRYAIGTTAGGINTAGWTTLGNVLTVTRAGLSLSAGTTYYFTVRSVNTIGLVSNTGTNSNGQFVVAIDTGDTTVPANIAVVRDGTGADVHYVQATTLTTLSANWDASGDAESGIARYLYAIGSSAGGMDTRGWTDNGQSISVTATGLTLTYNVTYYICVKAENGVGLQSSTATSNGQVVLAPVPPDNTAPVITLVSAQNITASGATIAWTTDEPSNSLVEYGRLVNYDKATALDSALSTAHSMAVINLVSGSLYHFRVISADASGNETASVDYTFTTLPETTPINADIHAYPNPAKPSSANPVRFRISGAGAAGGEVSIYTVSGRLIKKLTGAGAEISWDGTNTDGERIGRGIYIYKITGNTGDSVTGKIALNK